MLSVNELYTERVNMLAARYNLTCKDVAFCHLVANGFERGDAWGAIYATHQTTGKRDQMRVNASETIRANAGMTLLINAIKRQKNAPRKEDEGREREGIRETEETKGNELTTRTGILSRLRQISGSLAGKDELSAIQLLAKMQGFDRPDERETAEKRVYFLPWVSSCRNCALINIYNKVRAREGKQASNTEG